MAARSDACCASGPSCCGTSSPEAVSQALGYSADENAAVPAGANMGLGCGNPQAIAALKPGETVLDHAGTVTYHPLTAVLTIDAKEDAWTTLL